MEKRFDSLKKVLKYVELDIEGSFGNEGFTYTDFMKYQTKVLKHLDKKRTAWERYLLIRETGTEYCFDLEDLSNVGGIFKRTCRYALKITKKNSTEYFVEVQPIEKEIK